MAKKKACHVQIQIHNSYVHETKSLYNIIIVSFN